jgi:Sec-independent protein translocase protein TatA
MGRIGLTEILVVLVVAFILVQPKDLLHWVRRLGKAYQQMKSMRDEFVRGFQDIKDEVRKAAGDAAAGGGPATGGGEPGDRRKQA